MNGRTPLPAAAKRTIQRAAVRTQTGGGMNKTEFAYGQLLDLRTREGEVRWWGFEAIKLRLGPKLFYSPDFALVMADNTIECHEVKGFWRDDARAKIKMAAQTFPFLKFVAVTYEKKTWQYEDFSPVGIVGPKGEPK